MATAIPIKENKELRDRIVSEKGFWGYKNRYSAILSEVINKDTIYEDLSDENKAILHRVTRLDEDGIKSLSALLYAPEEEDDTQEKQTPRTRIGCILPLLPHFSNAQFVPFPEDKRVNLLEEFIDFLGISLNLFLQYNTDDEHKMPLELRHSIKAHLEKNYVGLKADGLLSMFNGNIVVDLSMYKIAARMEELRNNSPRMMISPLYVTVYGLVKEYNLHRGPSYSCRDMEEFCKFCNYIDFTFPKRDIKAFLSSDETYTAIHSLISEQVWDTLSKDKLIEYKSRAKGLSESLKSYKLGNSGIIREWKTVLNQWIGRITKDIERHITNSREGDYSDRMRLYMLQKLTIPIFGANNTEQTANATRLYAAILNSNYNIVREYATRLKKDNLGYKNYKLQVKQLEPIYRMIANLENVSYKEEMLGAIVKDLIPVPPVDSLNARLEVFESGNFSDNDLKNIVRAHID